jgi:hypothetical protein
MNNVTQLSNDNKKETEKISSCIPQVYAYYKKSIKLNLNIFFNGII